MGKWPGGQNVRTRLNMPGHARMAAAALLLAVLAAVASCGQPVPGGGPENKDSTGSTGATGSSGATPAPIVIDLSIALTESPGAATHHFRLVADGTALSSSTLPDPAAALAALRLHGTNVFFPVPGPPRACTQQYGGPQVAVVTGWFEGRAVNATFTRTDGCEIARWQAMAPLFGALAGGTGAV
jgi:hypothetical protein